MSQTVIGFFDDASEAHRAVEKLEQRGISRDRIDLSGGKDRGRSTHNINPVTNSDRDHNTVRVDGDRTVDREGRNTNEITDFFNSLFQGGDKDDDNENVQRYSHVAQRVDSIVTVHASSQQEAESAAEIMDDCGAVDVNERASKVGYTGSRTTAGRSSTTPTQGENRWRSRIVNRNVDDRYRLRGDTSDTQRRLGGDDQAH